TDDWKVGPITAMSMDEFKTWVKSGDTKKPLSADHFAGVGKKVVEPELAAQTPKAKESKPATEKKEKLKPKRAKKLIGAEVGDTVVPSKDFDYLKAGQSYEVTHVSDNGEVQFKNTETGASTIVSLGALNNS